MLGERMFALSIAWFVCPPIVIIPIASSLYNVAQPTSDRSYLSFGKNLAAGQAINYAITHIKK